MPARVAQPVTLRTEPVEWQPGEHVAVIGTTGTGKTYLMSRLTDYRKYVAIFRTKADDNKFPGFRTVKDHKPLAELYNDRLLIDPEYRMQARVGANVFETIWQRGGYTLMIDELFYVGARLGLSSYVDMLLTQGRSKRISIVTGMQRPVHVTRFAISECTHIFSFALERRDRKTIAELASEDFSTMTGKIPRYHFAHYYVPDRSVAVGTADRLDQILVPRR
jgi:hypothetical protein